MSLHHTKEYPDFLETSKMSHFVIIVNKWDKVFKCGLSKFCGRQPLKNFKGWSA